MGCGWVGGFMTIMPRFDSILQAAMCQILSLVENPRWSRVWQLSIGPQRNIRRKKILDPKKICESKKRNMSKNSVKKVVEKISLMIWTNDTRTNVAWTSVPNILYHLIFVNLGRITNFSFLGYVEVRKKDGQKFCQKSG